MTKLQQNAPNFMNETKLVEIFVKCDDFYKEFEEFLSSVGLNDPIKKNSLLKTAACRQVR
jgi:hypothetical protein